MERGMGRAKDVDRVERLNTIGTRAYSWEEESGRYNASSNSWNKKGESSSGRREQQSLGRVREVGKTKGKPPPVRPSTFVEHEVRGIDRRAESPAYGKSERKLERHSHL